MRGAKRRATRRKASAEARWAELCGAMRREAEKRDASARPAEHGHVECMRRHEASRGSRPRCQLSALCLRFVLAQKARAARSDAMSQRGYLRAAWCASGTCELRGAYLVPLPLHHSAVCQPWVPTCARQRARARKSQSMRCLRQNKVRCEPLYCGDHVPKSSSEGPSRRRAGVCVAMGKVLLQNFSVPSQMGNSIGGRPDMT